MEKKIQNYPLLIKIHKIQHLLIESTYIHLYTFNVLFMYIYHALKQIIKKFKIYGQLSFNTC
jgi:hypothetical protein